MSALDKAKKHFEEQLKAKQIEIKVPEWGMSLFVKPMNAIQRGRIMKKVMDGDYVGGQIEALICRAMDKDGNLLFSDADRGTLERSVDPDVISRVANEMADAFDGGELDAEEVKNS